MSLVVKMPLYSDDLFEYINGKQHEESHKCDIIK